MVYFHAKLLRHSLGEFKRNHENSVRIVSVLAEIQTGFFLNIIQRRHRPMAVVRGKVMFLAI